MENDNLIEFTSPSNSPQYHNKSTRTSSSLPSISSNPFDEPPVLTVDYAAVQQQFVSPSKINFEDFTCDFLCGETVGRESLLLTNDYARESLGIIDLDDLDIGRPSLGIERLKIMKKSLSNSSNDSILNKAFLYSPEDKNETTVFSTTSSSFNSNSLSTNLFPYSSIKVADLTATTNILNKRLYNSGEFYDQLKYNKFNHITRISSLPESLTIQEDDEDLLTYKLWNCAITSNSSDDLDPILIEARLIADRINNGLIFSEALDSTYTIEHTKQPYLVDNSYKDSKETSQESDTNPNKSNGNNLSSPPSYDDCIDNNNSNNHRDDSGGSSSIENHQQLNECLDEVLDLRLKTSQDDSKLNSSDDLPLDLSIKSKDYEFVQPKIIISKSSDKQQKNSINNSNRNNQSQNDISNLSKFSFKTTSNNSSNTSINSNNNSSLKIKKNEEKRKIGPLKAVIPIDNMLKTPVLYNATTPKIETKLKKTSTPINEAKMWPIAQSTPDTPSNNLEITDQQQSDCENRLNYSDSNLSSNHSKSINKSDDNRRLRYSWSEEDQRKQQSKSFLQRRSLSDLKRPQISKYDQQHSIPRSYSAGKDPKILSSIKRVRQTINKNDSKSKGLYRSCSTEEKVSQITDKTKVNLKKDNALSENTTRVGNNRKSVVKSTDNSCIKNINMGASVCKPCNKKRKINNYQGGSILDRVISQASNQDQCLLYRLANYKKSGELIDAYNTGGQLEVEKLIRQQFGQLMYQDGKGQIINRSEYLRWKFRDNEQVTLPIEASLSRFDPLGKWMDHEACWQMQYRGSLGESLLHVLIICDTKIHTRLARMLIKCFPKLAMDVVEGEEYLGASALHLAIAYNNNELVQDLVEAGANVNQRAIGSFFLPKDQQRLKPHKHTDYEGLAYLGEYPLAWAACCANESVYNLLLDNGAHPDLQDNFGNMILHMVVVCDKLDMFGYALRHPKLPASNGIVNKAGLTPLTLACKLGRAEVFREMLELSAKEFWRYSNITCSAYYLNALDTLLPDGRTNWNSALFIILNGTKEEHLAMLDGGIIQRLLEEKWKTFARNQFLKRLLILVSHLILLSLAIYLRPDDPDEPLLQWTDDITVIARYVCEIGTILGVLSYLILQQGDEIRNQGILAFLKQQFNSPPKLIFLISNLLILFCIPCRLYGDHRTEEAILVFAVPGSWFLLMFFAGAVRLTGPFVTMIYSMITGDMLTFGIIYTIVLFGFSQSFYFLYKGFPGVKTSLYNTYASTWMALFQITLGNYDYQELSLTSYPSVSKTVFVIFMVFVPILLLNMLIAMMGNTYAHVIEQSEKEWVKQWAKIVIALERAIPQTDAQHYLQEYSISLGPSNEDPTVEKRGVLIIKSKNKTRAKQRKGALANWKRVGKVTINALKKRGLTGEEMRCLMWGRESINTPVKIKGPPKNQQDLTGAVGNALTTALDVMAFTHDLQITKSSSQSPSTNLIEKSKSEPKHIVKTNNELTKTQLNLSQIQDPLRELILNEINLTPEQQKYLALAAANLKQIDEIILKPPPVQSTSASTIAGIFAGTETFVKKVEATIKKKYEILEPSDTESFGEVPILGKVSRIRRARSANSRNFSAKSTASDKDKLLINQSESSSIDDTVVDKNENAIDVNSDYAEDRIQLVREELKQNVNVALIRPINIDVALNDEHMSVTVCVEGSGSGVEVQSPNNRPKKRKRPKTAKLNKIAPVIEQRVYHSANGRYDSDNTDSPDPLEPWSTKGITNMNKILAWENDQDSL